MGVISKSLKTKFRQIYDRVESRFPSLVIQLMLEQPAQRVKAKGAALVLFAFGQLWVASSLACAGQWLLAVL